MTHETVFARLRRDAAGNRGTQLTRAEVLTVVNALDTLDAVRLVLRDVLAARGEATEQPTEQPTKTARRP